MGLDGCAADAVHGNMSLGERTVCRRFADVGSFFVVGSNSARCEYVFIRRIVLSAVLR
jgi:hypothetical protein